MTEIIEGKWEDLVQRLDLRGKDVRVIVFDEDEKSRQDAGLKAFHDWVDSNAPVNHFVDDSRESIYGGTVDDPR
jgi:deoxyadenosine/deoxycytidine kinase